ncbi:MAG: hypothetical protein WBB73_07625 [Candidatus Aminicenantaceae bacterium]
MNSQELLIEGYSRIPMIRASARRPSRSPSASSTLAKPPTYAA